MGFQWGRDKDAATAAKHGVTFLQAAQIFRGPVLRARDTRRDYGEERWLALGTFDDVVPRVVFAERDGDVRTISAWKASKRERETYLEKAAGSLRRP